MSVSEMDLQEYEINDRFSVSQNCVLVFNLTIG